ncbi:MAG: acyltransferase family protein, partial [Thermoplasmata archaeon]
FHTNHFWSLAVEEQFYILWPLFVLLLDRRKLIALAVAMMVASLVLRLAWLLQGLSPDWVYMLTPFRFDGLLVGAMVALTLRAPNGRALLRRWARPVWRVCAPISLALIMAYEIPRSSTWSVVLQVIGYPAIALAFGALIVFCLDAEPGSRLGRALGGRSMRFMGRYSYGIYVWHGLVLQLVIGRYAWAMQPPETYGTRIPYGLLTLALVSTLTIIVAFVSYNLFEKQFLALKRLVPYAHVVRQEGPPPAGAVVAPPPPPAAAV